MTETNETPQTAPEQRLDGRIGIFVHRNEDRPGNIGKILEQLLEVDFRQRVGFEEIDHLPVFDNGQFGACVSDVDG